VSATNPTDRCPRRLQDVILREIAGERFLVPIRGRLADLQELFVLNDAGEWVWQRLDGERTAAALAADMAATFEVTVDEAKVDIQAFVGELDEAGLLEQGPAEGAA
jgi:hypothetical protein